jgi:hypothetical protein
MPSRAATARPGACCAGADIRDARAAVVKLQRDSDRLAAGLGAKCCNHGRIDAAGHGDDDPAAGFGQDEAVFGRWAGKNAGHGCGLYCTTRSSRLNHFVTQGVSGAAVLTAVELRKQRVTMSGQAAARRSVPGPAEEVMTLADLPPADTRRWVARRKAQVLAAIKAGLIERAEARLRYAISEEELRLWERAVDCAGVPGLRVTRVQIYRPIFERSI